MIYLASTSERIKRSLARPNPSSTSLAFEPLTTLLLIMSLPKPGEYFIGVAGNDELVVTASPTDSMRLKLQVRSADLSDAQVVSSIIYPGPLLLDQMII